jgi:nitronate monooxygenase
MAAAGRATAVAWLVASVAAPSESVLASLVGRAVVVAPMAGGPSTPALVVGACEAGALGFVAAGYKSAQAMRADINAVAAAAPGPFGVNVFMPGPPAADAAAVTRYVGELAAEGRRLGTDIGAPTWSDDDWSAKIADLTASPVPVVSFAFGCPDADVLASLRRAGSMAWVTVTNAQEAAVATTAGADCLVVQGTEAGAHRGSFSNDVSADGTGLGLFELIPAVRAVTGLPLVAAGGIMSADAVQAVLAAGAAAVQCGTAFLRCPESGAHPAYKAALADPAFDRTAVTRAFSGRPARGLLNDFMRAHEDAPAAYPEINNATRPLRAAAAAAGDVHRMSLWAGEGFRQATDRPAAEVIDMLWGG